MSSQDHQPMERRGFGAQEGLTLLGLAFGFLLPVIGALAGLVGLWTSRFWTRRHKTVATALIPLTIPALLLLSFLAPMSMFSPWEAVIFSVVLGPLVAALYLLPAAIARHRSTPSSS